MAADRITTIDREIEASRDMLAKDIIRLVSIKSVQGEAEEGAPFGPGPRALLDAVLEMGRKEGFHTADYPCGVVCLALQEGQPDLGIWLHGDVVPEGEGWRFPPYEPTEYKGCIIGRGTTDNKGQLCAVFHLLRILKKLGIPLNYNAALYVGSNEETGMADIKAFLESCKPPRLSLVPDASFPVGYGGKGGMHVSFKSKVPFEGLRIVAGQPGDPGKAVAETGGKTRSTYSPPRHGANPDPAGNMITALMEELISEEPAAEPYRQVLSFFRLLSLDIHGTALGIDADPGPMRRLTLFAQRIDMVDGCPELTVNIRYPMGITAEEILNKLSRAAEENGLELSCIRRGLEPYLLDPEGAHVRLLTDISNTVTGQNKEPYTLGGATYAHLLPNALAFGMDGSLPPEDFPKGHGSAHGVDECVSLERLMRAMKIYARALLALDGTVW